MSTHQIRTPARLDIVGVCLDRSGRRVLDGVELHVEPGEIVGVIGPNGCGKSTLLRVVLKILEPTVGSVLLDGVDMTGVAVAEMARQVAAVMQDTPADMDLTVRDVVAMGRAPYKRMFARDNAEDEAIITDSLAAVGGLHLMYRQVALMSGGERQRVLIARALAQQPRLLVLDEPTNHLDIRHQFDALALPGRLKVTTLIALHDLTLAAQYCDRVLLLAEGRPAALGPPLEVLTPERLGEVYGVDADVGTNPRTGRPQVICSPQRERVPVDKV